MSAATTLSPGARTFARGIHPSDSKHYAQDGAIEVLPTPGEVRIPLLQHLGAPCEALVKPKTTVAIGDPIGQAGGFVSASVHASIDGVTGRVGATTLPNGRRVSHVPIKAADEQSLSGRALYDDVLGGPWPGADDLKAWSAEQIAEAARSAGLVGLGGATFPSHVKLLRNPKKPIDTLLINGCECEPYLTSDYRLMLESPEAVVAGALLARSAIGARDLFLCVEDNKMPAAEALARALGADAHTRVMVMKTKYPQGGEKQLIQAALKRTVPTGGLPLDVGVVVMNAGTCAALVRAVVRNKPLTHRVVSVTGGGIRTPKNLLAPVGASYQALIDFCGGLTADAACVISGGPMMGFTVGDPDSPITKGTSGVTVLTHAEARKAIETSCVRCGRCVDVCPMNLVPTRLAMAARKKNVDLARRHHIGACMECGCCAYVCPASLPLVQLMRTGKIMVLQADRDSQ